jgi:BMFP domain-containing protein YqiC
LSNQGNFVMLNPAFFNEVADRVAALAAATPVKDLEKNLRALLAAALDRFDFVSREEFDLQREALRLARVRLAELEAKMAKLEQGNK